MIPKIPLVLGIIALLLIGLGCSSVPKEVVELSYRTGEDLQALHQSYDKLIHEFFEQLRARRIDYLEERWIPLFAANWAKKGRLVDMAKGQVVWSAEKSDFVSPSPGHESAQLLETINFWATDAISEIEWKRDSLLAPLNRDEMALRENVQQAFQQVMRANAVITAHLNSLRKVQEVQDDALQALHLKDLRDEINDALVTASETAATGLEEIERLDEEFLKNK